MLKIKLLVLLLVVSSLLVPHKVEAAPLFTSMVYPVMSPRMSSRFGVRKHPIRKIFKHHSGIDLAVPKDTPVRVISDGRVVFSDFYGQYGNLIVVDHGGACPASSMGSGGHSRRAPAPN